MAFNRAEMFNRISGTYDGLNHLFSFGIDKLWRRKLVLHLKKEKPDSILDIATGTGDLAIAAAKKIHANTIVALDPAKKMLKLAEKKIKKKNLPGKIDLVHGTAEKLPFKNHSFDAVTVGFGVRNFEDLEKGLSEIYRVLKPKGSVFILEFNRPSLFPFNLFYHFYLSVFIPFIGGLVSGDKQAYKYLFNSIQEFPERGIFLDMLKHAGFETASSKAISLGIARIYKAKKI